MAKILETWQWSHGADGFSIRLYESSFWGKVFSDLIEASDMDWWGKYKNLPFCWINPWGWTYKIGTEDHNLGVLWWIVGQRVLNFGFKLEHPKLIKQIPVSDDEVKEKHPEIWDWAHYWHEEDDE